MSRVVVIGGGPAGMFAAVRAAEKGHTVLLLERNEKLGKKLYITGKGRCNVTNCCDREEFFRNIPTNSKFLFGALNRFSAEDLMAWFETKRVPLKQERGKRVFPLSDKASDITKALMRALQEQGVQIRLNERVTRVTGEGAVTGVETTRNVYPCDAVILATGGLSYSVTGSTGDGYRFAERLGHSILPPKPALVPILTETVYPLQGLSLKNVTLSARIGKKEVFSQLGEMLFTHQGISGPLTLSLSSVLQGRDLTELSIAIDLKPGLTREMLDKRVLNDLSEHANKSVKNAIMKLLPSAMVPVVLSLAGIDENKPAHQLAKNERNALVDILKAFPVPFRDFASIEEAIITRGGVSVKEISPSTMESKLVKGLYFAGEMIDVDGFTGGFNLQIAFSTGFVAGDSVE